jgi:hypothetical protein
MWEGLGSALVGAVATAFVTLGAVWLTLRHERRQQDSAALEIELGRLNEELRTLRREIDLRSRRMDTPTERSAWSAAYGQVPVFGRRCRRVLPAVRREHGALLERLMEDVIADLADKSGGRSRGFHNLEALLTWTALCPEVFTHERLGELRAAVDQGETFD